MTEKELKDLLDKLVKNSLSINEVVGILKNGPFRKESAEHITLDHHRRLRQGMAEVVLAEPKSVEQILIIADKFKNEKHPVLFTRLLNEQAEVLVKKHPDGKFNKIGRTFILHSPNKIEIKEGKPFVALFSGGTSDAPVIEEAADVCFAMGVPFIMKTDVGVAGLHRLLSNVEIIKKASAIVVVAGMEGALPSVIGGIAEAPVFAVPTSVGYGASFNGVAALLGMLNSCASGVTVSNIDNGFSAAFSACQVVKQVERFQNSG